MTTTAPQFGPGASARPGELPEESGGRFTRFARQVSALRSRATGRDIERWMLVAGGVLMPLGVLLVVLGWAGAAHTALPFEQTDYLISGGILGLALVVAGGFVYFGYWQTVRIRESREQSSELAGALARIETLLASGMAVGAGVASAGSDAGSAAAQTGSRVPTQRFVATQSGSLFHRPDCSVVASRDDVRTVDADDTPLKPCRLCTPLAST